MMRCGRSRAPASTISSSRPDGSRLYASYSTAIAIFDVASGTETTRVTVGTDLGGMDISPDGQYIYLTDPATSRGSFGYNYMSYRVETATGSVFGRGIATSDTVPSPTNDAAVLPDGTVLFSHIGNGGLTTYMSYSFGTESGVPGTAFRSGILSRSADHGVFLFGDTVDGDAPLFVYRPGIGISATHEDYEDGISGFNTGVQAVAGPANMVATNVGTDPEAGGFSI